MYLTEALKQYKYHFILILLLIAALYHSIVYSMVLQWYEDQNYSHGFIVPIISAYFIYQKFGDLKKSAVMPDKRGIALIFSALIGLTLAHLVNEEFTSRSSLIILLAGIILYFFGRKAGALLALPLAYLFFMVPLPYIIYDSVAFPLKLFVAKYSVLFLKAINIPVWREGNIIQLPNTLLQVADACSGIRSLMSLLALSVAFAFLTKKSSMKRALIIVAAIPIAIFANGLRVIVTGILAQYWSTKAAEGFFHEFAGIAVFGFAVGMLLILGAVIKEKQK